MDGVIREAFSEEATLEQVPQCGKGVNPMNIKEKSTLGRGNSMCKSPLAALRKARRPV